MWRGLATLGGLLAALGALLGVQELAALAAMPLSALATALAIPLPSVEVYRDGGHVVVELGRWPAVVSVDGGGRRRRFLKPPGRRAALRLRGPAAVEVADLVGARRRVLPVPAAGPAGRPAAAPAWWGAGEFLEVAPYSGEPARLINWRATARTGRLHVNRRAGERAMRAVVVADVGRLRAEVLEAAAAAAEVLAAAGYEVEVRQAAGCPGQAPCGDVTVYVGSLAEPCRLGCRRTVYLDVAGRSPLVAVRRLALYRRLRAEGHVVVLGAEGLAEAV